MDISEIRWLSVWCPRFTVNFAEIFIPHDPKVPRRYFLDKFPRPGDQATLDTLRSNPVQVHTIYTLSTHYLHTIYTLSAHYLHIIYTLSTNYLHIIYTLSTHYLHIIYT